jgi:hypothetical protein
MKFTGPELNCLIKGLELREVDLIAQIADWRKEDHSRKYVSSTLELLEREKVSTINLVGRLKNEKSNRRHLK